MLRWLLLCVAATLSLPSVALVAGGACATAVAAATAPSTPSPAATTPAKPAKPRGYRTIVLIRHGLYDEADTTDEQVGRHLTPQGREQARLTASRLAHFMLPVDVLRSSTFTRARETAAIIADSLPGRTPILSSDLCECTAPTERKDIEARHTASELDSCRQRLDRAYAAIVRPSPDRDTTEVVVCHGNVSRWFVCKALGIEPTWWLRFGTQNCSVTIIRVKADGSTQLLSYGDFGHLPPELVTSLRPPAPRDTTRR